MQLLLTVTRFDLSAEVGLFDHTSVVRLPNPHQRIWVPPNLGIFKGVQDIGSANHVKDCLPSILVSLERKRDTKDRAEFNMSKVSLKMA